MKMLVNKKILAVVLVGYHACQSVLSQQQEDVTLSPITQLIQTEQLDDSFKHSAEVDLNTKGLFDHINQQFGDANSFNNGPLKSDIELTQDLSPSILVITSSFPQPEAMSEMSLPVPISNIEQDTSNAMQNNIGFESTKSQLPESKQLPLFSGLFDKLFGQRTSCHHKSSDTNTISSSQFETNDDISAPFAVISFSSQSQYNNNDNSMNSIDSPFFDVDREAIVQSNDQNDEQSDDDAKATAEQQEEQIQTSGILTGPKCCKLAIRSALHSGQSSESCEHHLLYKPHCTCDLDQSTAVCHAQA